MISKVSYRHDTVHNQKRSSLSRSPLSRKRLAYSHPYEGMKSVNRWMFTSLQRSTRKATFFNAFRCLLVPVFVCAAHHLNSMVTWGVGFSGSEENCRNPGLRDRINRSSNLVSKYSNSSATSDALKREMGTEFL